MTILLEAESIQSRIAELAAEIERDYPPDDEIHLVGVLKGGFVFMADLVRAMSARVTLDFIAVSSYQQSTRSSGEVRLLKDVDARLEGRHVIIVEDIVDTGLTLTYLQDILRARAPKSAADRVPAEQAVAAPGRRQGRVHRLHDRGQVRHRLRARLRREVPQPAAHRGPGRGLMRKFEIITEADARTLDIGATVELAAGGHVTPLARDTLAERRVTVDRTGRLGSGPVPAIWRRSATSAASSIGSDHTGVALKRAVLQHLRGRGLAVIDLGTDGADPVDYPDIAGAVALAVARREADAGIVIDGAGHRFGDRGQQGPRDPGGDVPGRDDRAIFARAQRRQRDHARLDAACRMLRRRSGSSTSGWARRCARRATSAGS